jgi:hypothetical protein
VRNSYVRKQLKDAYEGMIRSGNLEIFCVDNRSYQSAAIDCDTKGVKASGIPDIRRFCFSVPATVQTANAKFNLIRISEIFNSAHIWINPTRGHDDYEMFLETLAKTQDKVCIFDFTAPPK